MLRIKSRAIATALIGMLSFCSVGCGNKDNNDIQATIEEKDSNDEQVMMEESESISESTYSSQESEEKTESFEQEPLEIELPALDENININSYDIVTATTNVNIRLNPIDGKVISVLNAGESLPLAEKLINGWYAVEYYGYVAFISGEYVKETIGFAIEGDITGLYYSDKDIDLFVPEYLNNGEETTIGISKMTCIKVFEEINDYYLCSVNNKVGYVLKSDVLEITGNYVVVDIGDQTLTLYEDDKIILETPVVTGNSTTPSGLGLFQIYSITRDRYLLNEDGSPNVYVKIMIKYNGGEGLHDAWWRTETEFGGKTYWNNGSHGCINMLDDAVLEAGKVLKLGDWVIVQE